MRAAMKLATGVVPVALGVAMALMSGGAKAEEKAAQPQPLTGAVSAQTTLPSVGHRPKTITNVSLSVSGPEILNNYYVDHLVHGNVGILFMPGHRISVESFAPKLHDEDNLFGGRDEPLLTCDVYRIDTAGNESLLNSATPCRYDNLYTIKSSDIGYKFRFQLYTEASKDTPRNYTPFPDRSIMGYNRYVTTQVVKPYDINNFSSSISKNTLMWGDSSDYINYDVTLKAQDGSPIKGMQDSLKIIEGGDSLLNFSNIREISDGVYSVTITKNATTITNARSTVLFYINGHALFKELITIER